MRTNRRQALRALATTMLALCAAGLASAQGDYPSKPIRLVVGSGVGDNTDIFARLLADELRATLGQTVYVENKPGAAGVIGGTTVATAPADGYTLLFGQQSTLIIAPQVISPAPYDSLKAFTPIVKTQQGASVVAVHKSVPAKTFDELVQLAKSKPEHVKFAVNNLGSAQHLAMEIVQSRTGIRFNTIPYKGTAPSLQAVVSGESDVVVAGALVAQSHIQSGALRPLAIYGAKRVPQYPDLPTLAEAVHSPELAHDFWYAVVGPAGMSKPIVDKLSAAIQAAMNTPKIKELMAKNAQVFEPNSPQDLAKEMAAQWAAFGKVARDHKIEMK